MPAGNPAYLRHRPEQTPLYRVVAAHAQTFFGPAIDRDWQTEIPSLAIPTR